MSTRQYCPVCGEERGFEHAFRVRSFDIGRCSACGLGATHLPPGFDPASIYTEAYFEGGHDDGYVNYAHSEATLRREFRDSLKALERHAPAGGRLLEVGCAYGFFLKEARERFQATGIELSEHASAQAREAGLDVTTGPLTKDFLSAKGAFDTGVMLDVVEHLDAPDQVLTLLRDGLRPGAALMITTGDWSAALSRLTGPRWRLMTPPQHLFFFDPKSITHMLERLGFRVVEVSHPWKTVPLSLIVYQLARYAKLTRLAKRVSTLPGGLPVNLFDAMRVIAVRN